MSKALGFVFPESGDENIGSFRIYTSQLRQSLGEAGELTDDFTKASVVYVGRGKLREFFNSNLDLGDRLLVSMNPSSELLWLPQTLLKRIDFFVAGSFEERSSLSQYRVNTLVLPQIETWISSSSFDRKVRTANEPLTLLYHGNKEHLNQMSRQMKAAIREVARNTPLRLLLVYDLHGLGKSNLRLGNVRVEHIQWSKEAIITALAESHIGIVPGLIKSRIGSSSVVTYLLKLLRFRDYRNIRFALKRTSNFGRALVFMQAGLPVIAEPTPSISSLIPTPEYGELAITKEDWMQAISRLSDNSERLIVIQRALENMKNLELDFDTRARGIHRQLSIASQGRLRI